MNSPTITMERSAAVKKLEAYEQAARENPKAYREMDRGILLGYRTLARGGRLVDVNEAIKTGGLNLAGQPKLAIARAHVERTRWCPGAKIGPYWKDHSASVGGQQRNGGGLYCYGYPARGHGELSQSRSGN